MDKKLTDVEKDELEDWSYNVKTPKPVFPPKYGLCSTCKDFFLAETEFGIGYAKCQSDGRLRPNSADPIRKCSLYRDMRVMTLAEMIEIATIIKVDYIKDKAGF